MIFDIKVGEKSWNIKCEGCYFENMKVLLFQIVQKSFDEPSKIIFKEKFYKNYHFK